MVKFGVLLLFSVTRFGEISTFWYNLKSQIFQGLSGIWHNFVPTVSKMFYLLFGKISLL